MISQSYGGGKMATSIKINNSKNKVAENDQVTGSLIYRRVDPEKKKEFKRIIKETAKKHGLIVHIIERK